MEKIGIIFAMREELDALCEYLTINNEYETYDYSLSDLEYIFNANKLNYFLRINKYIIVNLNYIESIEGNTVTINKKDYAVSRLKKAKLLESMSKFFAKGNY